MILRGKSQLCRRFIVCLEVPRHPVGWILSYFCDFAPESGEIMDGVDIAEATGLDHTHEEIADIRPILGFVEQRVLAMANRRFEDSLAYIVVDGHACFAQEQG